MEKLRAWLETTGTSQLTFAKDIGVSQPTVSDWLNGHTSPTAAKLRKIAARTGISIDVLLQQQKPAPKTPSHAAA